MTKKVPVKELVPIANTRVTPIELTVEYWRKRYTELFKRFDSFKQLVKEIGQADNSLVGYDAYLLLMGVHAGRRSLKTTAKIVLLMEQLRPEETKPKPSRLSRQKLVKPSPLNK